MARDPKDQNLCNQATEFGWGPGMFPPGVADEDGPDFGSRHDITNTRDTHQDNYARAVADRRTDPTDATSGRDFHTLGNPDRFGGQPPLIRSTGPKRLNPDIPPIGRPPLKRKP